MTLEAIFRTIGLTRDQVTLAANSPGHVIRVPRDPKVRPSCPVCHNAISTRGCRLPRRKLWVRPVFSQIQPIPN